MPLTTYTSRSSYTARLLIPFDFVLVPQPTFGQQAQPKLLPRITIFRVSAVQFNTWSLEISTSKMTQTNTDTGKVRAIRRTCADPTVGHWGDAVELHSLESNPELNGHVGFLVSRSSATGRVKVHMVGSSAPKSIKPGKLRLADKRSKWEFSGDDSGWHQYDAETARHLEASFKGRLKIHSFERASQSYQVSFDAAEQTNQKFKTVRKIRWVVPVETPPRVIWECATDKGYSQYDRDTCDKLEVAFKTQTSTEFMVRLSFNRL